MSDEDLLAEGVKLILTHGPDSPRAQLFIRKHADNDEIRALLKLVASLRRAILNRKKL